MVQPVVEPVVVRGAVLILADLQLALLGHLVVVQVLLQAPAGVIFGYSRCRLFSVTTAGQPPHFGVRTQGPELEADR